MACEAERHGSAMAKIIPVSFPRPRLPRSLLRDGWWLDGLPVRRTVPPFVKPRSPSNPHQCAKPGPKTSHLTLVHSRK
jgi:hypothetical protein